MTVLIIAAVVLFSASCVLVAVGLVLDRFIPDPEPIVIRDGRGAETMWLTGY